MTTVEDYECKSSITYVGGGIRFFEVKYILGAFRYSNFFTFLKYSIFFVHEFPKKLKKVTFLNAPIDMDIKKSNIYIKCCMHHSNFLGKQ